MIEKHRFRIYPTKEQEDLIVKTFGCCRFVYNYYLDKRNTAYEKDKTYISGFDCMKDLTQLKKTDEFSFLREVDVKSLQQSLRDLDTSFLNFFRSLKKGQDFGFPKFKSKHHHPMSYRTVQIKPLLEKHIILPKVGVVKCKISKKITGKIMSATVIMKPSNKFYVTLSVECEDRKHFDKTGKAVGIDLGMKDYVAILSDGNCYYKSDCIKNHIKRIKRLQRKLSRKSSGSKNYEKARIRLAKEYEKLCNKRMDNIHKITTDIIKKYDIICIEDLDVSEMKKGFNKYDTVSDVSFYTIRRFLLYKSLWYGKKIVVIDRYFPSSQTCSVCGYKNKDIKNTKVREWICPSCKSVHNRDINAAVNILNQGLKTIR